MNGIDNLATGAMTGNGPEVTYSGQDFAAPLAGAPADINIDGVAQVVDTNSGISHMPDSVNNLGTDRTFSVISSQRND